MDTALPVNGLREIFTLIKGISYGKLVARNTP
jgi:hypothetical protein